MAPARALVLLAAIVFLAGAGTATIDAATSPDLPADEAFAIWPADTPAEADAECSFLDRFTWRGSAEATTERFAREMLRATDPEVEVTVDTLVRGAITGGGLSVDHGVLLRASEGCWYVTSVGYEDDFGYGSVGYSGEGEGRRLYLHVPSDTEVPAAHGGSLGSGGSVRRFDSLSPVPGGGGLLLTVPARTDEPGHYLLGPLDQAPPTLGPAGGSTVSPPFDPATLPEIPSSEYSRRVLEDSVGADGRCKGWYWSDYSRKHAVRQTMTAANHYAEPSPRFDWRKVNRDTYVVTINGVEITFEFWSPTKRCHVLGRISTAAKPYRVEELRAGPGACAFTLVWERADEAKLQCAFGDLWSSRTAARLPNPIFFGVSEGDSGVPFEEVRNRPGHYLVGFYDDDELIGIEGGALPPPSDFR
jgi:hypothetical protein